MKSLETRNDIAGLKVLIVEDRLTIAAWVVRTVESLDCMPYKPLPRLQAAFEWLSQATELPDIALLDIDLHGELVYPFAAALRQAGVPIIFTSGFGSPAIEAAWRAVPKLVKPFTRNELAALLRQHTHSSPALAFVQDGNPGLFGGKHRAGWRAVNRSRNLRTEGLLAQADR